MRTAISYGRSTSMRTQYSPWQRLRRRLVCCWFLLRRLWRMAGAMVEDEERLLFGDPRATEPVGLLPSTVTPTEAA